MRIELARYQTKCYRADDIGIDNAYTTKFMLGNRQ